MDEAIAEQTARAARRADPGFDADTLGLTLALLRAAAAFERAHVVELAPHGLTISQFNVLTVLDRSDAPVTMGELGLSVSVRPANLTGVVDHLVGLGHVERLPNPADRRSSLVRITATGEGFLRAFLPAHWSRLAELMSKLSPHQRGELQGLLELFLASVTAAQDG